MSIAVLMTAMSLDLGGAETHVVSLARRLKRNGHRVLVASRGGVLVSELASSGISHLHTPLQSRNPLDLLKSILETKHIIEDHKVDIVHAHGRIPAWTSHVATRFTGKPLVTTYHGTYSVSLPLKYFTKSGVLSIAVSWDIREHLVSKFRFPPCLVRVIPNGIDLDVFHPRQGSSGVRDEFGLAAGQWLAVHISRLDEDTFPTALAFVDAVAMTPGTYGLVVGDGNRRRDIETRAALANREAGRTVVVVVGGSTQVECFLQDADIVVGAARVALEAMACGKPVVLAGEGGFVGLIHPGNVQQLSERNFTARGLGIPCEPGHMAQAMTDLQTDPARLKQLGRFGYELVRDKYSIDCIAMAVESVYREALGLTPEQEGCLHEGS